MGDNISSITHISKVKNRGLISREGPGSISGEEQEFLMKLQKAVSLPWLFPGLHRRSPTDPRFKVYSHQSSPEKIGIAYEVSCALGDDVIVSDVSSNTVTLLISAGKLVGLLTPVSLHRAVFMVHSMWTRYEESMQENARQMRLSSTQE